MFSWFFLPERIVQREYDGRLHLGFNTKRPYKHIRSTKNNHFELNFLLFYIYVLLFIAVLEI